MPTLFKYLTILKVVFFSYFKYYYFVISYTFLLLFHRVEYRVINGKRRHMYYLVMEFCCGGDLHKVLHKACMEGERIPESKLVRWGQQIASAITHLESRGIVHRDIKPRVLSLFFIFYSTRDQRACR